MEIIEIKNKEQLNNFVAGIEHGQFLQSWEWGELQEKMGNKIFRLGVEDNGAIVAVATLVKKNLGLGLSYFFCARGPVAKLKVESEKLKVINFLFIKIKELAKQENAIFLRFEPQFQVSSFPSASLGTSKFQVSKTIDIQPSKTMLLDLIKTEDELLAAMHQKTRYNIRLAEKKGIKVIEGKENNFDDFWQIMSATSDRDKFRLHNKNYYKEMVKFNPSFIKLYLAEYQNKIIAGNIISFFGDTVTYIHGASANEYRDVMAPYALQWQVIKTAKARGHKYYDFFGIDENKWPGVTRFKAGFGGIEIEYSGTYDLAFNKFLYNVYKMFRTVRRTF